MPAIETRSVGLLKTSLIDFPSRVAAVAFLHGCNFRCPYCHNPPLIEGPPPAEFVPVEELLRFLHKRKRVLDGVVITGGEPLLSSWVVDLVHEIRACSLEIKIDTNGSQPERLKRCNPDYVALDIKCAPEEYPALLDAPESAGDDLRETIDWVRDSGVEYEFRTTVVPGIVSADGIEAICTLIAGAERYVLQAFKPGDAHDRALRTRLPYPISVAEAYREIAEGHGITCELRGW